MDFNRTPDDRFGNLADFPFAPNYVDVDDTKGGKLRMHYVDEGPKDGPTVAMIHGNPTWSYMWRKLIPVLADKGYRAIAIDLIGSGRSDKPTKMTDYTIARHEAWVKQALFEEIGVKDAHFILHDWGGNIGLRAIADNQDKVSSIIMSNTGLANRDPNKSIKKMSRKGAGLMRAFQLWIRMNKGWKFWKTISKITLSEMPQADIDSYAAPYPDKSYLTGLRKFTQMLPTRNDNPILTENWQALQKLKDFERPFLNLFSDKDQIAPRGYKSVRPAIPGTRDYEPIILKGGSHFLVEDIPEDYAREVIKFYESLKA